MSRSLWEDGVEIVIEDLNRTSKATERGLYDRIVYELIQRTEDAFFSDSFKTNFASATSLTVLKGTGFQTDNTQTSPEPTKRLLYKSADANVNISAPDGSNDRIDILTVKAEIIDEITETRKFKDAISDAISDQSKVVQRIWDAEIQVVAGTPNAVPVAPATPAGYIKIAEVLVTAVTGISGSGAITDTRSTMPIGGDTLLNTLGYLRLTAGATTPLSTLMGEIDVLLKDGKALTNIWADSVADPAAPGVAGEVKMYQKAGLMYIRKDSVSGGSAVIPVGSGGGGGGGLVWTAPDGEAPILDEEFGQDIYKFQQGLDQRLSVFLKLPQGYLLGQKVAVIAGFYSPSSADEFSMQATASLIRKNVDAISSTANQEINDTGDITNTVANQYRELTIDLTTALGAINALSCQPGDIIKIDLERNAPAGSEDAADIRFIPSSTEVKIG